MFEQVLQDTTLELFILGWLTILAAPVGLLAWFLISRKIKQKSATAHD